MHVVVMDRYMYVFDLLLVDGMIIVLSVCDFFGCYFVLLYCQCPTCTGNLKLDNTPGTCESR